ncbi:hypothetical protein [Clostridium sp. JNZ J1-5]|nr:hypothetical protein [Clostridium sp.]
MDNLDLNIFSAEEISIDIFKLNLMESIRCNAEKPLEELIENKVITIDTLYLESATNQLKIILKSNYISDMNLLQEFADKINNILYKSFSQYSYK